MSVECQTKHKEKVIIIGVGNVLRRDDGVGVHVIKALEDTILPNGVEVYDGGLGGFKLLDLIESMKKVIFIDAIEMGLPPGTVKAFLPQEATSLLATQKCSLHNSDLLEVIKFAEKLDNAPEIKIVGVQPANVEPGLELSVSVKDSIPQVIQTVVDII